MIRKQVPESGNSIPGGEEDIPGGMEAEHVPSVVCQKPVGKGAKLFPRLTAPGHALTQWGWALAGSPDPVFLLQEKCMGRSTPSHLPFQHGVTPFC